jgi:hypothetical protein
VADVRFFPGIHQPCDARHFDGVMISVNRLRDRKSPFAAGDWIMDSGAFSELQQHGGYRDPPTAYAAEVRRWAGNGTLLAAVSQDYMCEPAMLAKTGLSIAEHQRLTIERYDALIAEDTGGVTIMPVLQGYAPADYVDHIRQYGARLAPGAWVGVGSVCKRNGNASAIEEVLLAINRARPDLRLHLFGVKITSLKSKQVREVAYSADSMAWSFSARKQGRNGNDWREAAAFARTIRDMPVVFYPRQISLPGIDP